MAATVDSVRPILRAEMSKLRVPSPSDKVYKDECVYSFDSPFSDSGLYVNLATFQGIGANHLKRDSVKTGSKLYLHQKWSQVPKPKEEGSDGAAPSKLAIGVAGGFMTEEKYDIIKEHHLVVVDGSQLRRFELPNQDLPEFISNVCNGIIAHDGMKGNLQLDSWDADNEKIVSKYAAGLVQVNPEGKKIPQDSSLWYDEETGDKDNLWLNLSTGYIGGGRRNWDGTGGSGSALRHYEATGKRYPLVVKLGTITPHGADVWSYAAEEDCLVIDPQLGEHLSFWGIDIMRLEKTSKTLGEMEVALNMSYDWSRILSQGDQVRRISGPGYVGLVNIGSSCYMNSILQTMLAVPEVAERYLLGQPRILETCTSADPTSDVLVQLSKLAHATLTDSYVPPATASTAATTEEVLLTSLGEEQRDPSLLEKFSIAPRMFKHVTAKGHREFSSGRQQDASEYFQYLLGVLTKAERVNPVRLSSSGSSANVQLTPSLWEFHTETRWQCLETGEVRYGRVGGQQSLASVLELPIPLDRAIPAPLEEQQQGNEEEVEGAKRQKTLPSEAEPEDAKLLVPFSHCLETFTEPELVDLQHPALGRRVTCSRTSRFACFPRYLMVKLGRYTAGANWVQVKINARVDVPELLDLTQWRAPGGLQPGEREFPQEGPGAASSSAAAASASASAAPAVVVPDEGLVGQLMSMGFSENGSKRAAVATHNADVETAMGWVLEHMEDSNFNEPLEATAAPVATGAAASAAAAPAVDPEVSMLLQSMGYTEEQTRAALMATDFNVERAADWLFSHVEDLDAAVAEVLGRGSATSTSGATATATGGGGVNPADAAASGRYELLSVISHIGKNTDHGHYVCHIKKNNQWVLFNDDKVGVCEKGAPLQYGFMYMYRRIDGPGSFEN